MALIRWEPARELRSSASEFDRLFNSIFDTSTSVSGNRSPARPFMPAMDIVEADGDFVVKVDLPGVSEQDVSLEVQDGVLTIAGERKDEREARRDGYYRLERSSGSFRRSLTLPDGVDPDALSARFEQGVLEIHIPKPEARQPRRIAINVGGAAAERSEPSGE